MASRDDVRLRRGAACFVPLLLSLPSFAHLVRHALGMQLLLGGWTPFFIGVMEGNWGNSLLELYVLDWLCAVLCAGLSWYVVRDKRMDRPPVVRVFGAALLFLVMRVCIGGATICLLMYAGALQRLVWMALCALMAFASLVCFAMLWRNMVVKNA